MKYGGRDLRRLLEKARDVTRGEAAPEEVEERGGDFYIIPITLAGKERTLFFAPFHMAKLSAFVNLVGSKS
jgi:hypothetical protein